MQNVNETKEVNETNNEAIEAELVEESNEGAAEAAKEPSKSAWQITKDAFDQPVKRKDLVIGAAISIVLASLGLGF